MEGLMERKMVCISCPLGCRLTVTVGKGQEISVKGNRCAKGESYAREEILAPRRVVTATVKVAGGGGRRLPVKTSAAVLKEHIPALLGKAYRMEVEAPVRCGQVLLADIAGAGADLVATRSLEAGKGRTGEPSRFAAGAAPGPQDP
jgi:CxxC motif-containing protein